jgi:DNA polymerase V
MMVKDIIWQEVGIPVGVGIGRTKVLAKIANRIAKKSHKAKGVVEILQPHYLECALKQVAIEDVWGIGRANAEKMRALGIKNSWQLREYKNEQTILKIFTKVGLQIKHELQEISCFPFNKPYEPKKEIMCSRTFGGTVTTIADLKQAVASYVSLAAEKLRSQNSVCQEISVFARTNPFNGSEQTYLFETKKLPTPTADTFKLIDYAFAMLEKNFSAGYAYKKAGVRLLDFYQSREYQLDFFAHHDTEKSLLLMHALDKINYREGEQTLQSAACGVSQIAFKMNRNYKSPRYTTSWNELLVIKN